MKIRLAGIDDLERVSQLWVDMVKEEYGKNATPNPKLWIEINRNLMNGSDYSMFVVQDKLDIIGFVTGGIYHNPRDDKIHGESPHIYVKPEYRKGKVGLHLYHNLAKRMIRQGAKVISFYCKVEKIEYWKKKGYVPTASIMSKPAHTFSGG